MKMSCYELHGTAQLQMRHGDAAFALRGREFAPRRVQVVPAQKFSESMLLGLLLSNYYSPCRASPRCTCVSNIGLELISLSRRASGGPNCKRRLIVVLSYSYFSITCCGAHPSEQSHFLTWRAYRLDDLVITCQLEDQEMSVLYAFLYDFRW